MIRKRYAEGPWGQIHLRENRQTTRTPLACLHATAYSSRTFEPLLAALDGRRYAMAVDTPGYGESDAPPEPPTIAHYADALVNAFPGRVDLFGYHTGVSIAVEIALRHPERVGCLTLMGVPHFRALDFAAWRERLAAPHLLVDTLDQFAERWRFLVEDRAAGLSLADGFGNFVDELKAWPNGWWAHEALFSHDLSRRLPLITQPVTIINPAGHLAEPSRVAARLIQNVNLIELPQANGSVLIREAASIANLVIAPKQGEQ